MPSNLSEKIPLETRVVALAARQRLLPEEQQELARRLSLPDLDWPGLVHQAHWHRLAALLFHHLRQSGAADPAPPDARRSLERAYLKNTAQNLYLGSELQRVLAALAELGIPAIVLKGHALLTSVFPNPALRTTTDVDLLVSEAQMDRVQTLVGSLGYWARGTPAEQARQRDGHHHLPRLISQDGAGAFEIHSHIVPKDCPLRFDLSGFWERARPASFGEAKALVLAPEDLLTHLSLHFFLDRRLRSYAALGQLCDIAESLRYYQPVLDWDLLAGQAQARRLTGPVHLTLLLARSLLDAPVPVAALEQMAPPGFRARDARRFLQRRVLATTRVAASELVDPNADYSVSRLLKGMARRVIPVPSYLSERYGEETMRRSPGTTYLRRLGELRSVVRDYIGNPLRLWQDFLVDRWIHSLQKGGGYEPTD